MNRETAVKRQKMTTLQRTIVILNLALVVMLVWSFIGSTGWGASRSAIGAGPDWLTPVQPFIEIVASLLLTITGSLLLKDLWAWLNGIAGVEPDPRPQRARASR